MSAGTKSNTKDVVTNNKTNISNKLFLISVELEKAKAILQSIIWYFEDFNIEKEKAFIYTPNILSNVLLDYLVNLEKGLNELN